jgi:hypothetical protein
MPKDEPPFSFYPSDESDTESDSDEDRGDEETVVFVDL